MIPPEKSEAVARALQEAFGVDAPEEIAPITKGQTSSLVFRVVARGTPYLLKVIVRPDDPTRHYECMRAAAEAGLAPPVWYASARDKVSITGFVESVPFSASEALVRMPAALRALHALPPFSPAPFNTTCTFLLGSGPALEGFLHRFQAMNLLPALEAAELLAIHAQLAAAYPRAAADQVASHNDLFKPDNILFDGQRVQLVDWEAASLNDRYADLAVVANMLVESEADELAFLESYFGQAPDPQQRARFFLMQQLTHLFYAITFRLVAAAGGPVDEGEPAPDFRDFNHFFWAGEVELTDSASKVAYARAHHQRLLQNVRSPRYREALSLLG